MTYLEPDNPELNPIEGALVYLALLTLIALWITTR